jgi:methionyl-tRNA formyltransferase
VNCGEGSIQLEELQLEGKSAVDAKSFINGHPDLIGSQLG